MYLKQLRRGISPRTPSSRGQWTGRCVPSHCHCPSCPSPVALDSTEPPHLPPASIPEASGPARAPLARCLSSGSPTFGGQAGSLWGSARPLLPWPAGPSQRGPCVCLPLLHPHSVTSCAGQSRLSTAGPPGTEPATESRVFCKSPASAEGRWGFRAPGTTPDSIPVDPAETIRSQRSQEWFLLGPLSPLTPRVPGIRGWAVSRTLCDQQAREGRAVVKRHLRGRDLQGHPSRRHWTPAHSCWGPWIGHLSDPLPLCDFNMI